MLKLSNNKIFNVLSAFFYPINCYASGDPSIVFVFGGAAIVHFILFCKIAFQPVEKLSIRLISLGCYCLATIVSWSVMLFLPVSQQIMTFSSAIIPVVAFFVIKRVLLKK
jgi:hypothetical protein